MSIDLDWEVTDAPSDDGGGFSQPPPTQRAPGVPAPPAGGPRAARSRRRHWWLAVPLVLLVLAAFGLNYITRLGWQRITDEVIALVRYEDQLAQQGETLLVLRVQDYTNSAWLDVRSAQVAANQPAPLPVPVLTAAPEPAEIGPVELVAADWVRAEVFRRYETPDGQRVTFALPQFYRRPAAGADWVRTSVPDSYWGPWQDWHSPHLFVRHSQRDNAFVTKLGPRLEDYLSQACLLWADACVGLPPSKLFLSGFVGSLEYDPLANVRVRVEFRDAAGGENLPADYFVSVPSPLLAGAPADEATEAYLTAYLAVRLIAALADSATATRLEADSLTADAVARLGLGAADPGFAARVDPRAPGGDGIQASDAAPADSARATAPPAPGATVVTRMQSPVRLETYEVQAGDTLLGIATSFGVSVGTVAQLNGIANPDLIQAGTKLLIPLEAVPGW